MKSYLLDWDDAQSVVHEPSVSSDLQYIAAARQGISRQDFIRFAGQIKHSLQSLAQIMPASYSSLTKKKIYDQETSERILELARLYRQGKDVFGSIEKFNAWLHTHSIALAGQKPFDLLDTSFGVGLVAQQLGRIDYGLFS